ncbi:uncharacterized protein FIESC28_04458 [Fusarium coffeatum]|uniref:Uncharacterized protein n=1 Tax=Fusarium coffeatum TaxID=231269 RepID=A0A366RZL5_9HYPO|nr:uncharacterized protein FIESC28_04458 [Fusarium coffeatum]RBR22517.1 hypothetical protein FIESC28_04458 [Fusarium coffeatum]
MATPGFSGGVPRENNAPEVFDGNLPQLVPDNVVENGAQDVAKVETASQVIESPAGESKPPLICESKQHFVLWRDGHSDTLPRFKHDRSKHLNNHRRNHDSNPDYVHSYIDIQRPMQRRDGRRRRNTKLPWSLQILVRIRILPTGTLYMHKSRRWKTFTSGDRGSRVSSSWFK